MPRQLLRQQARNNKLLAPFTQGLLRRRLVAIAAIGSLSALAIALAVALPGDTSAQSSSAHLANHAAASALTKPSAAAADTAGASQSQSSAANAPGQSGNSSSSVSATSTTVQSTSTAGSSSHSSLKVNGRQQTMPQNGSYQKTINTPSGQVHLKVSHNSGAASNTSSTNVQVQSDASTSTLNYQDTQGMGS
ncbi:MAG: hypothetical protein ACREGA_01325 [Candidatus Saccharimonadales bacterium]